MPRKGYSNVSLPDELLEAARKHIAKKGSLYASVSELIKEAVREKLRQLRE